MSSNSASDTVDQVLQGLQTLGTFSYQTYKQSIKDTLAVDTANWNKRCVSMVFGEDPGGNSSVINRFKVETIALGVSRTSSYGFSACVVKDGLPDRIKETASAMVVPIYRKHLEDHLNSPGCNLDILSLISNQDFCQAFATRILDPNFINDALIASYFSQTEYVKAIAYIYERIRATLLSIPASKIIYNPMTKESQSIACLVATSSLPQVDIFSSTVQASQALRQAGKTDEFLACALPIEWSDKRLLQKPSFPTLGATWSANWLADTYATDIANSLIHVKTNSYPPHSFGEYVPYVFDVYGDALWSSMESWQNNGFSDIFQMKGTENMTPDSLYGCFSPQSMVATSSGDVPIHSLGVNDKVLTRAPGEFGYLSDERVQNDATPVVFGNKKTSLSLYGFNGDEPFVTAGHIFFTIAGPKAIVPQAARRENPRIHVGKLVEGDILLKLNQQKNGYDQIKIESIASKAASCNTIHGLHFARGGSGGGRYHVNGYWVAENYPQITIEALQTRFKNMNFVEQHAFRRQVQNLPDTFQKVFGQSVYNAFQQAFSPSAKVHSQVPIIGRLAAVEKAGANNVSVKDITAKFNLVHTMTVMKTPYILDSTSPNYKGLIKSSNEQLQYPEISLFNGAVLIDGVLAKHTSMSHLSVQWSHGLLGQPGVYQHGVLRSIYHGKAITGYIGIGSSNPTKVGDMTSIVPFFALADANDYALTSSPAAYPTIAAAEAATPATSQTWNTFWKVEIGLVCNNGGLNFRLSMPDLDAEWNRLHPNSGVALYTVSPASLDSTNSVVSVPVAVTPGLETYLQRTIQGWGNNNVNPGPAFSSITILLNLRSNAVHGYYTELVKNQSNERLIHALFSPSSYSIGAIHASTINAITRSELLGAPARNANVHDPAINIHHPALPATQVLSERLFSADDLSIADLQTTPAPSDTDMNALAQKYMQNAASYWRAKTEVDVFGDEKQAMRVAIPDSLGDGLYSDGQTFLGTYSRAIIMQSLSTQDKFVKRFSNSDQDNLRYYWQGTQKGCLSQDVDFNKITKIAASASFLKQTPGLEAYIEDSKDWAAMFYTFLTTDDQLNNQALAMFLGGSNNLTNRYCMILSALDTQNRNYDVQLWKAVRDKLLVRPSTGTITDDDNEWPKFAEEFAKQLIIQIQSGTGTELLQELNIDLQKIEDAFGTKSAAETAGYLFNDYSDLGRCFINAFKQLGKVSQGGISRLGELMSNIAEQVNTKCPRFTKVLPYLNGITGILVQSFSIYQAIKFLMNWSHLSDADKASAILSLVNSASMIFKDVASLVQRFRGVDLNGLDPNGFEFQINCVKWDNIVGQEAPKVVDQEKLVDGTTETKSILSEEDIAGVNSAVEGATLDEQVSQMVADFEVIAKATKKFSLSETVAGGLAVAANIATAVCIGFQIANDFATGQSPGIETMDILSEAAVSAQVITGALEMGFAVFGVESAALPIVGAVVALIGIVLMFVGMFVPRKAPEDPVNKYLDTQLTPFINPLPNQPKPLLTYAVTSSGTLNKPGKCIITVTDPTKTSTLIKSIIVRFMASNDSNALFAAPSGSGNDGNPTTNAVTYTISGERLDFIVAGSKFAPASDNSMIAKVASVDSEGAKVGDQGLQIVIEGVVNGQPGVAEVKVTEGAANRPDGVAGADVYTYFKVLKWWDILPPF